MKPIRYGASWKSNVSATANVAQEIVSAADNARGIIVHSASFSSVSSSTHSAVFIVKNSAPVSVIDGDVLLQGQGVVNNSNYDVQVAKLENSIFIRQGVGLYFISSTGESASVCLKSVLYDLL